MKSSVLIPAAIRGRYSDNGSIVQRLELRPDKCTNTLTSVQKDNIIVECCIDIRFSTERSEDVKDNNMPINVGNVNPSGHGMNGTVYDVDGVSPTLTTNKGEGVKIRIKSPASLHQTIIYDDYNRSLQHIMENLYDAMPYLFDDMSVGSFFSGIGAFEKALSRLDTKQSEDTQHGSSAELTQIGYINDYNGDANRVNDGAAIARALKAEAGGGRSKDRMVQCQCSVKVIGRIIPDSKKLHQNQEVYDTDSCSGGGISPTIKATHYKDPPKIEVQ